MQDNPPKKIAPPVPAAPPPPSPHAFAPPPPPDPSRLTKPILIVVGLLAAVAVVIAGVMVLVSALTKDSSGSVSNPGLTPASLQAERDKRDVTRRTNVTAIVAEIQQAATTKNNSFPTSAAEADKVYNEVDASAKRVNEKLIDPKTKNDLVFVDDVPELGELQYAQTKVCDGNILSPAQTNPQIFFAIRTILEDGTIYCLDNQGSARAN